MDIIETKLIVALLFVCIRLSFGTLPIKVKYWLNSEHENIIECTIVIVHSFGGGVLFATCFLHMMPEVNHLVNELRKYGVLVMDYPFSQLVISMGFFTIYFLEEICQWLISRTPKCKASRQKFNEIRQEKAAIANGLAFEVGSFDALPNNYLGLENEKQYVTDEVMAKTIDQAIQTEAFAGTDAHIMTDADKDINAELEEIIKDEVKSKQQILRYFLMVVAVCLHAFFEGFAIGLQHSVNNIWYLFIAVSIHSATVLYVIGSEVVASGATIRRTVKHIGLLSTITSCGVLLGLVITLTTNMETSAKSFAILLLEGLSTGTILYITFFETLKREKERKKWRLTRAIFIGSGFILMAALQSFRLGE